MNAIKPAGETRPSRKVAGDRTPLVIATGTGPTGGWRPAVIIEADGERNAGYSYTAIHFTAEAVMVAYCAGGESDGNRLARLPAKRALVSGVVERQARDVIRAGHEVPAAALAEIQGLYGVFSFPEKLLQKIWVRGDFNRAAASTTTGRRIRIVHPGKWNLLGGPDFLNARLRFDDGGEIIGDVEAHLRASDWDSHGHALDPAYDRVRLHVVLFPPEPGRITRGGGGREIPILVLLPLLHHDLEEFAADEAVETLANRAASRIPEELGLLPAPELGVLLRRHSLDRWRQKVHFARLRIQRLGWEAACHHAALEILGYRFNRPPMLRIAAEHPLAEWGGGEVQPDELYQAETGGWSLQGVRPANHPRTRLRQYANWTRQRPGWPAELDALAAALPVASAEVPTREARHRNKFPDLRERLAREVGGDSVGGTRLDNLICDGVLPLVAARTGFDAHGIWFHWFVGDLPPVLMTGLRALGVCDGRAQPACHGVAQGLLGWLLQREAKT
ncbi:MAG: DUF2851 family protein [Opitutaceae bacterium]|nr:DUF2851 family protein [Opitutaceae bacterium]